MLPLIYFNIFDAIIGTNPSNSARYTLQEAQPLPYEKLLFRPLMHFNKIHKRFLKASLLPYIPQMITSIEVMACYKSGDKPRRN